MVRTIALLFLLAASAPPKIGDGAPAFSLARLTASATSEGQAIDRAWLSGQVTAVEFFATWCAPCRENLDDLREIQGELGNRVRVLVIAVDEPAKVREFLKGHPSLEQVAWALDSTGEVARRWGEDRLPTTFFLDKKAIIRRINRGHGDGFRRRATGWLRALVDG